MADDLSLLLKIRGDSAGGRAAVAETRAAIASLRSSLGNEFGAIQNAGSKAFASITDNLNVFVGQRIPLVGGAFVRVSENLRGFGDQSDKTERSTAKLVQTIEGLARETGKSSGQIVSFLTKFVQLETQAKRDTAAIETFGAVAAQKLIPQLERAGAELSTVAAESTAASSSLAGLAGPLGIAVLGILATVAATGLLGKALFDVSKQAAAFQGKMFDLSQQTGVAVETLSALEIVAKTTGGSIESIAQSLVIFQGKLDEAQDSSSKAGEQFKKLGIDTKDTETAFREALSVLAAMPQGFHQTNEAAELFGRRGGKQVLAILKELHGDLDGAIGRFREMGILITEADAKAADEFNDQLAILGFQLRALGATIGKEVVPVALDAIKDLSAAFKNNRDAINDLAKAAGLLANLFTGPLKGAITIATVAWAEAKPALESAAELYERIAAASQLITGKGLGPVENIPAVPIGSQITPEIGAAASVELPGLKSGLLKAALEASRAQAERELEVQRHLSENLKLIQDQRGEDLNNFYRQQQRLSDDHFGTLTRQIARERAAVQAGFERGEIDQADFNKAINDLNLRATEAQNRHNEERQRLEQEKQNDIRKQSQATVDVLRDTINTQLEIAKIGDASRIASLRALAEARIQSEEETARAILQIRLDAIDREKEVLETELKTTASIKDPEEQLKTRARINLELRRLAAERTAIEEQGVRDVEKARQEDLENERKYAEDLLTIRQRIADIQRETARTAIDILVLRGAPRRDVIQAQANLEIATENSRHERAIASLNAQKAENLESNRTFEEQAAHQAAINREIEAEEERHNAEMERLKLEHDEAIRAAGPEGGFLGGLATGQLEELKDGIQSFADAAIVAFSAVGAAIGGLAQGFGQLIQNWVLLGSQADINMKKLVASVLAGVAAQAAVLAIFELAKGFASLFFNPAEAAAHFQAAALFGSIAIVTGLAGRALAGNSFQRQETAGAGAGTGGTTTTQPSAPQVQDVNRRPGQPGVISQVLQFTVRGDAVVDRFVQDYRLNGLTRVIITSDGQA